MRKLIIVDDEGRKTTVPLVRSEVTIGRQEGNTIRLTERNVSRLHARVYRDDGKYFVEDRSRYGTQCNGQPIEGTANFAEGDVVVIGTYRIQLHEERAEASITLDEAIESPESSADATLRLGSQDLTAIGELAEQRAPSEEADVEPPPRGRLVCMSEPFVGSEFFFTADDLTIGTSDACDLIIEHPSIAPNHARFFRTNATYSITPIDAGYPVALNGAYNPSGALAAGDEVLLGELKFRFVLPGEAFTMVPLDEIDDDVMPGTRPAWLLPAVIGVGVVVLIGLIMVLTSGGEPNEAADPGVPAVDTVAASPWVTSLETGRAHMNNARWADALAAFAEIPSDADEHEMAASLSGRATNELANSERYAEAVRAFDEGEYQATLRAIDEIPPGTFYRTRAEDENLERQAVNAVVQARIAASQVAQDDGDTDEARRLLTEVQPLAPDHPALIARLNQLNGVAAEPERNDDDERDARREAREAEAREAEEREAEEREAEEREAEEREAEERAERTEPEPRDEPEPEEEEDEEQVAAASPGRDLEEPSNREDRTESARELRQQAARAGVQQNFQEAIRLLEEARELNPGDPQINLMLFSNYRQVGNRSRAARAIRRYLRQRPNDSRRAEYEEWLGENAPE